MVRYLLTLFLFCSVLHAEAVRVKSEQHEGDKIITQWGTAWIYDGPGDHPESFTLITCAHVVDSGDVFAEDVDGSWIKCMVKKKDSGADLACLIPLRPLKPTNWSDLSPKIKAPAGLWCWMAPRANPVQRVAAALCSSVLLGEYVEIKGFTSGASGSPVLRDGVLVGIAAGNCGLNGTAVADTARIISAEMVRKFLEAK
jgi:hypothetical protein